MVRKRGRGRVWEGGREGKEAGDAHIPQGAVGTASGGGDGEGRKGNVVTMRCCTPADAAPGCTLWKRGG